MDGVMPGSERKPGKIGIIETRPSGSMALAEQLKHLGYTVCWTAASQGGLESQLEQAFPDLVLFDHEHGAAMESKHLARMLQEDYAIPVILLSHDCNEDVLSMARDLKAAAFLQKPHGREALRMQVELVMMQSNGLQKKKDNLLVKEGNKYHRVQLGQVQFISSEFNYVCFHQHNRRKITVRSSLTEIMQRLDPSRFFRINRGVIINADMIDNIEQNIVWIGEESFKITKERRAALVQIMHHNNVQ